MISGTPRTRSGQPAYRRLVPGWGRISLRSAALVIVTLAFALAVVTLPIWRSIAAPTLGDGAREAPWLVFAYLALATATLASSWLDSGRKSAHLAPLVICIALSPWIREALAFSARGVQPLFLLPILAGGFGGPAHGVACGAFAGFASGMLTDVPMVNISDQVTVLMLLGAVAGLTYRLGSRLQGLLLCVVALAGGVVAGWLLNIRGWAAAGVSGTSASPTSFIAGLGWREQVDRLARYTIETSLGVDLMRGVSTTLFVLFLGLPLIAAFRHTWAFTAHPLDPARSRALPDSAFAQHVLDRRRRIRRMWPEQGVDHDAGIVVPAERGGPSAGS